jgi:hypothetical protein
MIPRVAVVVVNHNRYKETFDCLQSLTLHLKGTAGGERPTLILVDSGSTDGSCDRLRLDFPNVTFMENRDNVGFGAANNIGMEQAFLSSGAKYVLLLNNDAFIGDDVRIPFLDVAVNNPTIGIQCAKVYYWPDKTRLWYAGGILDVKRGIPTHRGIGEEDHGQYDRTGPTDFATGCALFISRECYDATKGFDPGWFVYHEDSDLCVRARQLGYSTVFNHKARVWHAVGTTATIDGPVYLYFTMRNKLLFAKRHGRGVGGAWPYFGYFYGRQLVRMGIRHGSWRGVQAVFHGLVDGLRGVTGKGWMEGRI